MDLIYADGNGIELGVIQEYDLDIAFGRDENNFSITLDINDHCCKAGYSIYIEGTEYGGIVDKIIPNTKEKTVTYEGRTWHGVLENKIISPDTGEDYKIVSGEANIVLASLIDELGLADVFTVSEQDSSITIGKYQFERYTKAYTAILDMLYEYKAKLNFNHNNGVVILSVEPLYDYSEDEEWNSSQFDFSVTKNYHPTNHLICLGGGDLKNRRVIHLFTDENGGIQPYARTNAPISDENYILDTSGQLLFGLDELTDIYDYGNAATTENYILLSEQPSDWKKKYVNYYSKLNDKYIRNEKSYETDYVLLTEQPSDWKKNYANYNTKSDNTFKSVEGVDSVSYKVQKSKPKDWKKNFVSYYYYWSDGVSAEYKSVSADSLTKYKLQTMKPSDWADNYGNYYVKKQQIVYIYKVRTKSSSGIWKTSTEELTSPDDATDTSNKKYIAVKKKVKKYVYENVSASSAPKWKKRKYYTAETERIAPEWKKGTYYYAIHTTVAPEWKSGTYYSESEHEIIPDFKKGTYYQLYIDHYADLVAGGVKKLKKMNECDEIGISLDATQEYDINDIIGAAENITGISVAQPITKKVVKIKNGSLEMTYEIGE